MLESWSLAHAPLCLSWRLRYGEKAIALLNEVEDINLKTALNIDGYKKIKGKNNINNI